MSKQKVNCAKGTREADLGHAVLSASGSHRWLNCTPSARLELEFENTTSEAAREGTAAHALCEHKLKKFLKKRSKRPVSDYNSDEMEECTDAYAEFVMEQYEEAKKSCKDPVILIEQKLDFSCYVPEGYGAQGLLKDYTWYWVFIVAAIWTLFAVLASIAGKFITDKGIGNGISLILLTNILVSYPNDVMTLLSRFVLGKKVTTAIVALIFIITGTVALFAFTYVLQDSQKNIPVNYSAKISGSGVNKRVSSIPLKLCPGGVVPIIFATSIMTTPVMIASVFGKNDNIILNILNSAYWFQPEQMVYSVGVIIYIALIFGFSYFYTGITINPADIAEKIKKAGGNISGIRPGKSTVEYIKKQTKYMTAIGAAALVLIALIPIILGGIYGLTRISFLGTSIIITVGVILDTRKVIQTEMQQGVYIEQMKKGGLFHA